ncbi:hypothetical protein M427DRAFT_72970 [Gonapodya prolifera JEL478]|uniref:Uncharacterized protein n=1 Tax=Gonapodya prolifera (strain JEL478) TaxID=1344416 RepID=A0A139A4E2_GONPJ|nr:hypothetical protein M427DRAFT_72970 [Gonapodya prolifera JEL478]|eukprot:KXS11345.1 hypothetical protein M427DRAFT_72970 [Gonapodya prolifera JEL478]
MMSNQRPPTPAMRPGTSARQTSWGRQGGVPPKTGLPMGGIGMPARPPGTSLPFGGLRPGTSARLAPSIADRPVTQQGLGGIKTSYQGQGRLVMDASFFASDVRLRGQALRDEMAKLERELEEREREAAQGDAWAKKSAHLSATLATLLAHLADLNLALERAHAGADPEDLIREAKEVGGRSGPGGKGQEAEGVMGVRRSKEALLRDLEAQLDKERRRAEDVVASLPPPQLAEYRSLAAESAELARRIADRQREADAGASKMREFEEASARNPTLHRALLLHKKMAELRAKRDEVAAAAGEGGLGSREGIVEDMKKANQEAAAMERRAAEVEQEVAKVKERLDGLKESGEGHAERRAKFSELARRDRDMTAFLESCEKRMRDTLDRNTVMERDICDSLERIATLARKDVTAIPSQDEYKELQGDLKFKEKEMKNSENTLEVLSGERVRLLADLAKVDQLESKIPSELVNIKEKMAQISAGILKYGTVEELRKKAEAQKAKNTADRAVLSSERARLQSEVAEIERQYDLKRRVLEENETHMQLAALEEKLRMIEKNNDDMKEYIESKTSESDYKALRAQVLELTTQVNDQLLQIMALPPAR